MKVRFLYDNELEQEANKLCLQARSLEDSKAIDVVNLAFSLGFKLQFEDLQCCYGKGTLGMIILENNIILCDISTEPRTPTQEHILRFTIAHELGHYALHQKYMDTESPFFHHSNLSQKQQDRMEIQANLFASMLLMPREMFIEEYQKNRNIKHLSDVFQTSRQATEIRIKQLGL